MVLTPERYAELSAHEEFVLTVSENGYGKRTSAYDTASPAVAEKASSPWSSISGTASCWRPSP